MFILMSYPHSCLYLKFWPKLCQETGPTKGKGRDRLRPTLPSHRTEPVLLILSWLKPAFSQWREAERVWAFCFGYFHNFQWWGRLHRDETFMTMWKYIKLLQLNWMWDLTCTAHPHSVSSRYDMWRWVLYKSKQNFVCTLMHSDLPASCNRMAKALKKYFLELNNNFHYFTHLTKLFDISCLCEQLFGKSKGENISIPVIVLRFERLTCQR